MDRSTPIYLVETNYAEDAYGAMQPQQIKRLVYANVQSVTRAEWFEGGRAGLNPQFVFTMFGPDYNGEDILEYDGTQYAIYRSYRLRTDLVELYAELKKGSDRPAAPTS